ELTLEDFLEQLQQLKSMGPLSSILEMLPGIGGNKQLKNLQIDEKQFSRVEAIIKSMTSQERRNPAIIKDSRKKRIAKGSGVNVSDVSRLLKQFEETRKMMKQLTGSNRLMKKGKKKGGFRLPF
ncbi:MAG TPA: signal recognition particle protein, partial [Desulfobacteria bacterium]|nr:signal recognition particle protein [Desulfobacteria bacterium]